MQSVQICGRKIPLSELGEAILHRQESYMYMHLNTDDQIRKMSEQDIHEFMVECTRSLILMFQVKSYKKK